MSVDQFRNLAYASFCWQASPWPSTVYSGVFLTIAGSIYVGSETAHEPVGKTYNGLFSCLDQCIYNSHIYRMGSQPQGEAVSLMHYQLEVSK